MRSILVATRGSLNAIALLALAAALAAIGCGDDPTPGTDGGTGDGGGPGEPCRALVSAADGGTVECGGGRVRLTVPVIRAVPVNSLVQRRTAQR